MAVRASVIINSEGYEMRKTMALLAAAVLGVFSGAAWAEEAIQIAGSGGMIPLMTDLASAYMQEHPGEKVDVNQTSIESTGGIQSAAAGRVAIGISARALKPAESSLGVSQLEIARVPLAVGVNDSVKVETLSAQQVCDIFTGKLTSWKAVGGADAPIQAFTRPDADSTKGVVRMGIDCFTDLKEAPTVIIMPKAPDMLKALTSTPNSIGFLDIIGVAESAGRIKAIKFNGIAPTDDNVKAGRYRLVKNYHLITKGAPTGLAKRFIDFILSDKGAAIIKASHALPVR